MIRHLVDGYTKVLLLASSALRRSLSTSPCSPSLLSSRFRARTDHTTPQKCGWSVHLLYPAAHTSRRTASWCASVTSSAVLGENRPLQPRREEEQLEREPYEPGYSYAHMQRILSEGWLVVCFHPRLLRIHIAVWPCTLALARVLVR